MTEQKRLERLQATGSPSVLYPKWHHSAKHFNILNAQQRLARQELQLTNLHHQLEESEREYKHMRTNFHDALDKAARFQDEAEALAQTVDKLSAAVTQAARAIDSLTAELKEAVEANASLAEELDGWKQDHANMQRMLVDCLKHAIPGSDIQIGERGELRLIRGAHKGGSASMPAWLQQLATGPVGTKVAGTEGKKKKKKGKKR
jgi:predicted RNase H-like nuclease (RuvC/YqgF family)